MLWRWLALPYGCSSSARRGHAGWAVGEFLVGLDVRAQKPFVMR
jgi:hypothetical protein